MTALLPMAMYGLEVPAGDVAIPAVPDIPSAFRITMAAIDPTADAQGDEGAIPRATLKVIRQPLLDDEDDESDFDQAEMERMLAEDYSDEESEENEDTNGGPSDPEKSKKAKREAAQKEIKKLLEEEGMDLDDDEDEDDETPNGVNGIVKSAKAKGKMPAGEEDEDEDDDSESMEGAEIEEFVICTLDPTKTYQQYLDITFGEDERVFFKVTGTHNIFLTGNYVEPAGRSGMFDPDSDEEEEYDLSPDEDELDDSEEESIDELDDLEDPRIHEIEDEDDDEAPALTKAKKEIKVTSANKKRAAPDSADEDEAEAGDEGLDEMIAKEAAKAAQQSVNGEQKLSKKQLKKLKKNDGAAAAAPVTKVEEAKKEVEVPSSNKSDKKVSFAEKLETGPTPTKDKSADNKAQSKSALGVKTVQGVTIDDKKLGTGQAAKSGDRVSMRYIGKLKDNNKVFDSNKKGKPFSFKLGSGEVIKGWDIGVAGMQAGGERRITIPAHLAYGSKRMGNDIPPNSALVFDIKMLEINKK